MKLVVQRVKGARVSIQTEGKIVGKIGKGLLVLVGIKKGDSQKEAEVLAEKLIKLRVMKDREKKMNLSIKEIKGGILVVSQFTLYADTSGGNRPSFIEAAQSDEARQIYEHFVNELKEFFPEGKVETGSFGDYMEIEASLDGPVTIIV